MASSDSTMVTGAPTAARMPRSGDVLGERWEIRASISSDGLYATYRGTDQETGQNVLVRVIGLGRLSERDAQRMAARMRLLIRMGGPVLSPIRDVDHEGMRLFSVEKFPDGASFRSVLETRRAKNQLFTPAELVPLVAHLHAALSAITSPWFHGDVRAERIYVGTDRVLLTGGFALAVMSGDLLRETLSADGTLRRELAPECAEGVPGPAGDRWGVAALVWEALLGARPPEPIGSASITPPQSLGELGPLLVRYLSADPANRPHSLEPMLSALAARARVPVPRIHPESFSVDEPPTDIDQTELALGPDPLLSGLSGEAMASLTSSSDTPSPSDTAKHVALDGEGKRAPSSDRPAKRDLSDIDPALLAAARASRSVSDSGTFDLGAEDLKALETSGGKKGSASTSSDLDPRLVRAALGVSLESGEASDTLPVVAKRSSSMPAPKRPLKPKSSGTTQEIDASDLEIVVSGQKQTKEVLAAKRTKPKAPLPSSLDSAETFVGAKKLDVGNAPRPVLGGAPLIVAAQVQPMLLPPSTVSAPTHDGPVTPQGARAPAAQAPLPQPLPPPRGPSSLDETPVQPQPLAARMGSIPPPGAPSPGPQAGPRLPANEAPTRVAGPPISGNAIIAIAVAIALLILGAAFYYRHAQESAAREHRIDERLRELRHDP